MMATNLTATSLPAEIHQKLSDVERRTLITRMQTGLLKTAACFLALLLLSMLIDGSFVLFDTTIRLTLTLAVLGLTAVVLVLKVVQPFLKRDSLDDVAYQVDRSVPALEERWSTVLNLSGRQSTETGSTAMLDQVRTEATAYESLVQPNEIVDRQELVQWRNITLGCVALLLLPFLFAPMQMLVLFARFWLPLSDISLVKLEAVNKNTIVPIEESLTLTALLTSGEVEEGTLFINREGKEEQLSLSLVSEGVESPRFLHQIKSVEEPFTYRWRAGDGQTEVHKIDIAERPAFEHIKFKLTPPAYTKLPAENLNELPPRVRAVKGSQLTVEFRISQPLDTLTLKMGEEEELVLNAVNERTFQFEVELEKSFSFSPHLTNEYGLSNRKPPLCRVTVYEDRAPAVSIITPDDEIAVPGDDEIDIEFMARDDFAITKAELVLYKENPEDPYGKPVEFKTVDIPLDEQQDKTYLNASTKLDLNELNLQNDDVLSYAVRVYDSKENVSNPESNSEWNPQDPNSSPSNQSSKNENQNSPNSQNPKNQTSGNQNQNSSEQSNSSQQQNPNQESSSQQQNSQSQASSQSNSTQQNSAQQNSNPQNNSQPNNSEQNPSAQNNSEQNSNPSNQNSSQNDSTNSYSSSSNSNQNSSSSQNSQSSNSGSNSGSNSEGEESEQDLRKIRIGDQQDNPEQKPNENSSSNSSPNSGQPGNPTSEGKLDVPPSNQESSSPPFSPTTNDQGEFEPLPFTPDEKEGQNAANRKSPEDAEPGATPPPNEMGKRMLDIEGQNSTSSQQRIVIDEFASRFEGQRRKKYQMAIDPVLKKLKELLTNAEKNSRLYHDFLQSESESVASIPQSYKSTAAQLKQSLSAVQELKQKSTGTPYAFIGLQLDSIQELHINPAADLWADLLKLESKVERQPVTEKTIFHIQRALILLDQLTRKYENIKRDEEIADKLHRIDKLYQVYLEDSFQMLGNPKPINNVTEGKPVEYEDVSEEYLKKLEEILKKRQELYAELAKILAEDPRLLKRFMDSVESKTTILREKLSEMNVLQQRITQEGEYWQKYQAQIKAEKETSSSDEPKSRPFPTPLLERHQQEVYKLVEYSGSIHDKFVTWLPKEIEGLETEVQELNDRSAQLTNAANALLQKETTNKSEVAKELIESYEKFEERIKEVYPEASNEFKEHLNHRVDQINELQRDLESWIELAEVYEEGDYLAAAEIDQFNLLDDLYVFVSKFQSMESELTGFPIDIRRTAFDLKRKLQIDASSAMTNSEAELHRDNLEKALEHQRKAHEELDSAEKLFDQMLKRMMEEIEKAPVPELNPDDLQFNLTLEDLLAMLEREGALQERTLLAILRRQSNLQIVSDWIQPGPGGGGGMSGVVSAQLQQQQLNRLQDDLLKKAQVQMNKPGARKEDWNKLISTLEEGMKQNQGKLTPEQYRAAIDQYFEVLARELAEER
ncbi:MAG: DUF4175 family protein [Planctomycetaceae bacterium]|nr:DUF4175 family protein [Planctomycetaceae bacterium]